MNKQPVKEKQKSKFNNYLKLFCGILVVVGIALVVYAQSYTAKPPPEIDYEVLREWNLPAGGIGMELLVSETATREQVLALATYLHSKHSRGWLNISIYDSREAHASSLKGTLSDEEFLKHVLVSITRNPDTGYDKIEWLATERGY